MENETLEIIIEKYSFDKILFETNESFDFSQEDIKIGFEPLFNREIFKIGTDTVSVSLSCKIESENLPFKVEAKITANFRVKGWESNKMVNTMVCQNTVAILFPYLRAQITSLTASSGMPPLILPIMNIVTLFKDEIIFE